MSLLYFAGGLVLGFVLGVGAALFYLKWKMQKQIGDIQEQMGAVMDLSEDINEFAGELPEEAEQLPTEETEEKED